MSDTFNQMKLGSLITELPKSMLPASAAEAGGHYHFFCSSSEVRAISSWLQEKPAVIMGTGGVASVNYSHEKYAYSTDTWCFRSQREDVQTKFLFRKIQQLLPKIEYVGFEGSGLKHLRKEVVKALLIDVPKKNVQNKIIEILDAVDDSISVTESLIAKYQKIKAGLMHDLFTRGVTADGKLRPPREQAPELYQETPIGWIPLEWVFTTCDRVCEKIIDCKNRTPPETPDGHPVIRTPNVRNGEFVDNQLLFTDSDSYMIWTARGKPQSGYIVITREAPVGEVCMIPKRHIAACLGQRMMLYRPNVEIINPVYFLYALQSQPIQGRLNLISGGSTVGHVRVGDIRELWIVMPKSLNEQDKIASSLNAISEKIRLEKQHRDKLQNQKLGLMQDLLTGKVPVKSDEPDKEFA
ncbi:MAG: restriction endonuclease subunit S [Methylococcaceae bacterium]|jgi:type I restriction enzyme S subunit